MQNLLLVICSNDVEAVFIKGKRFYQPTMLSFYFQSNWKGCANMRVPEKCYGCSKDIFELCGTTALTRHF